LLKFSFVVREHSRILVVDDDPDWLELITEILMEEGHAVVSASSGARALALLPTFDPAVVLTDMQMPGMNGRELLTAIHARSPDLPVVVLTGDRFHASGNGFEDAFNVLLKPPPIETLLGVVAGAAADGSRRERAHRRNHRLSA
jgi:DNA-binding NtrC family response regulator